MTSDCLDPAVPAVASMKVSATSGSDASDAEEQGPPIPPELRAALDSDSDAPGPEIPESLKRKGSDSPPSPHAESHHVKRPRKRKTLPHESLYLSKLPDKDVYEKSFMHRDSVSFALFTKTDFLVTASADGHIKFWKKVDRGVEFVKHFRAHTAAITGTCTDTDGALLVTCSSDGTMKVFDVFSFDMINIIKLSYKPRNVLFCKLLEQVNTLIACSDAETGTIRFYEPHGDGTVVYQADKIHKKPVTCMGFNAKYRSIVSVDEGGMVEYWKPEPPFEHPDDVDWDFKADTSLYEFKICKTYPSALSLSPDCELFATYGTHDRQVRVFRFRTGKMIRRYDESLKQVSGMQQGNKGTMKLDDMEFGRRLAVERELEKSSQAEHMNLVFDASGNFLIYTTLMGIKILNIVTNKVARILGTPETQRFLNVTLYQGAPKKKQLMTFAIAATDNPSLKEAEKLDPTIVATSFKRNRFFLFTTRDYSDAELNDNQGGGRDVFNEKPSREEQTVAAAQPSSRTAISKGASPSYTSAIMHTTVGDIHIRLYPEFAPKAVESFTTHAKNGYYNGHLFHRCIRGFMIQTGDPLGDGTGGDSIWGKDFEDEFHSGIRHDRPYTVSMANAGAPNTNGSQFFITVVAASWLDNKHTIFGRAIAGMDVIHRIEKTKVDKNDKPRDDISILDIDVS